MVGKSLHHLLLRASGVAVEQHLAVLAFADVQGRCAVLVRGATAHASSEVAVKRADDGLAFAGSSRPFSPLAVPVAVVLRLRRSIGNLVMSCSSGNATAMTSLAFAAPRVSHLGGRISFC